MKLGFVSAILPDLSLEEVVDFASKEGFACVELMCWPVGKAERRYAGVTHVDVATLDKTKSEEILSLMESTDVQISGLGYYPNPLCPNQAESKLYVQHIKKVIAAARMLKVNRMNTFVGRDWTKSVDDNWPQFLKVWKPIIRYAEDQGVKVGIENCPMFFTHDEWPGGKNLATCPAIWDRMFNDIDSKYFGLNFDPSHFVWQEMDYISVLREYASKLFHIHAKDARLDRDKLNRVGLLANPSQYHTPKLPGLGDVDWGRFLATLGETGYRGPVCIEVEDRVYEGSVELRKAALRQSGRYLQQFMP
ncbi:MAG: sugar phosphate isomerase/epimerase [Phycisphaerae bacterium]|nr:sugar phosphate isomerase/epimerase [Phycisphaerae bacterium]